ncbi:MAG: hypothetical protein ACT6TH_02395 [Brevundimonas sp.]|uniref:hypothetical protein n=1 Tax=Brevundimonas sp. TaxID=1871086 RepID=UPI004033D7D5
MRKLRLVASLFGVILLAAPQTAFAQDGSAAPPASRSDAPREEATALDDVVVNAPTLEQQALRFTEEASNRVPGRGLARWAGPVCIGVFNLQRSAAEQIADGLAHVGGEHGVPIADGACEPNILIVGAADGRALAAEWVARERREFRPNITDATLSQRHLDAFVASDAPARWWAISRPAYYDVLTGRRYLTCCGMIKLPVLNRSLQSARTRDDLQRLIVILDVSQLEQVRPENLIAYLSLVVFSQVDLEADLSGYDTVLNLFGEGYAGAGLSSWDQAYLETLYASPEDLRINAHRQAQRLARRIRDDEAAAPRP